MSISVVILTLNEEVNIAACIAALAWCDDVVVYDSYSTDATTAIGERSGARVFQRRFDNYAAQRNAAMKEVPYRNEWLLMVDADERWPADLVPEMNDAIQKFPAVTLFHFRRKDMFMGRWIKRSSGYPTWFGRLMKISETSVQRAINEEYHTAGDKGYLQGHFIHYPFNKGIEYWFARHNRYSTMEADIIAEGATGDLLLADFVSSDPAHRRRGLKRLVNRLPFRPAIVFLALYIVRGGFLDGVAGFHYSAMKAVYEYLISLKVGEARRRRRGQPV